MPELGTYGSVRGALSNERPYRESGWQSVKTANDPERTLAQGESTSTSACFCEVDDGSPSRTYAILGWRPPASNRNSILVSCANLIAPAHLRRARRAPPPLSGAR